MKGKTLLALAALAVLASGCVYRDPISFIQPSATYKQAEALYLRRQFTAARAKFRQVANNSLMNDKKWSLEARFYAARCAQLTGHLPEAVRSYNQLLRAPKYTRLDIRALAARADLSLETRDYRGAARDYGRARKLFEKNSYIFPKGSNWGILIDREKLLFGEGNAYWCLHQYRASDQIFDLYLVDYGRKGRFIDDVKSRHTKFSPKHTSTTFYVLVGGIFTVRSQADTLARKVRAKGFGNVVLERRKGGGSRAVYVVRVGAIDNRQEVHALRRELLGAGFRKLEVRP